MAPADKPDVLPGVDLAKLRDVGVQAYLVRFAFGAVISIGAGILGKVVSPRFGGVFLAFPAILPASLTLIQGQEGTRDADRNAIGAVLGGMGLAVFAGVGEATFGRVHPALALLMAFAGWLAAAFGLYALLAFLRPEDCDRHGD